MKKNVSYLLVLFCLSGFNPVLSQWGTINSLTVSPVSGSPAGPFSVIAQSSFNSGGCSQINLQVNWVSATVVEINSYHCLGALTFICGSTDTTSLGNLTAGNYIVFYNLIIGDGSFGPCSGFTTSDADTLQFTVGCPMPVATFTYSSNGDTARFNTPTPTNNSGFYWTFGDGGTSSAQNPTHIYADTGTYTVCLFLSDSCGTDTLCHDISICDALFSDFTPNYILSGGNSVYFTNSSTGATSWIWNFGDGSTSTDFNPTHNFPSPGTYWVCLFNFNACGSDTFCDSVAVFPTGIKTSRINRDIQFINPNQNGNFAIRNKLSEDLQLKIINLEGKLTFNTTLGLGLAEFDFNYFPKGLYVLEIVNHQNEKIWTQKWIR